MPLSSLVTFPRLLALSASAALAATALAADGDVALTLRPGDPAPPISIEHWVKGDGVGALGNGTVTVVEFWATWCGPCRAGMPHISELQEKYKDQKVTILGVSDEPLEKVAEFLAKPEWAEKTRYTLATDPDRSTHKSYMQAAYQRGIPTAFIVGKTGAVEWIGHPMTMDEPLAKIVKGDWDVQAFRSEFETRMRPIIEMEAIISSIDKAAEAKDWNAALAGYDRLINRDPNLANLRRAEKFKCMLTQIGDAPQAYTYGRELVASFTEPELLNQIAWLVVDDKAVTVRDLKFAMEAATKANDVSKGENAAILDTLARVWWENGNRQKAIEIQKQAVAKAPAGPMADSIKETLKKYESE